MAVDRFFYAQEQKCFETVVYADKRFKSLCVIDDRKPAREVKTSSDSIRFGHGQITHKLFAVKRLWSLSSRFHLD